MLDKIEYTVQRIDGDYAFLKRIDLPEEELKCVARAILPVEINEGCKLIYEMLSYELA